MKKLCAYLLMAAVVSGTMTSCETIEQNEMMGGLLTELGASGLVKGDTARVVHTAGRMFYRISDAQQAEANRRARAAYQDAYIKSRLTRSKTRYVAVPVSSSSEQKKSSGKSKMVVLYDTEKNKTVGNAYKPADKKYAKGEEVSFGGKKAVVGSSFSGI